MAQEHRASARYVEAALELLDRHGSADPSLGVTIKSAEALSSVTRSTLYRCWDSVADLNDDVARFTVAYGGSWQTRWLEQPHDAPIEEVLEAALGPCGSDLSLFTRTAVSAWPTTSRARADIAAWEWRWLHAFGNWIHAHLEARGEVPHDGTSPLVKAVTVAGYIEGALIILGLQHGMPIRDWRTDHLPDISTATARLIDLFAEPVPGPHEPPVAPDIGLEPMPIGDQQLVLLQRVWSDLSVDLLEPAVLPVAGRLVDLGRLARHLGVTERVLYRTWPTSGDMNVDLLTAVLDRHRHTTAQVAAQVFAVGLSQAFTTYENLLISAGQAVVGAAAVAGFTSPFAFSLTMADPEARAASALVIEEWRTQERTTFLALMAMCGWHRRPEVDAEAFASIAFDTVAGMQRLVTLNRRLLDETASYRGTPQPLMGLAVCCMAKSIFTEEPPASTGAEVLAPAIGPLQTLGTPAP